MITKRTVEKLKNEGEYVFFLDVVSTILNDDYQWRLDGKPEDREYSMGGNFGESLSGLKSNITMYNQFAKWIGVKKYKVEYEVEEDNSFESGIDGSIGWSFYLKDIEHNIKKLAEVCGFEYFETERIS